MSAPYSFTEDWFQLGPVLWPELVKHLPDRPSRRFLEIGSFEGRSAVWIIENMARPSDHIFLVDTWEGGAEHSSINMKQVEERFDANIAQAKSRLGCPAIHKIKTTSTDALAHQLRWMKSDEQLIDFIYIDGSHLAHDVLTDACMAWQLLRTNGVLVFDDYLWGDPRKPLQRPKVAIDAFMNIFGGEIVVLHISYQVAIKKVKR